jgi:hypothetical protein
MKKFFKLFASTALACAMVLLPATACGDNSESSKEPPKTEQTLNEKPTLKNGEILVTVYVKDQNNAPVKGVQLQCCKAVCLSATTDDEGKAYFAAESEGWHVNIIENALTPEEGDLRLPAGYSHDGSTPSYYDITESANTFTFYLTKNLIFNSPHRRSIYEKKI